MVALGVDFGTAYKRYLLLIAKNLQMQENLRIVFYCPSISAMRKMPVKILILRCVNVFLVF